MPHDFSELFACYPEVIAQMPQTFSSNEFVLRLAHRHQIEYVEALYYYRRSTDCGEAAPFCVVNRLLAGHLAECSQVRRAGNVDCTDIFGEAGECALWRKT